MECVKFLTHTLLYVKNFSKQSLIYRLQSAGSGHSALEILVGEHHGAVHEITKNCNKLIIVTCLKITPCKVIVLGLGSIGCQYIAQHILLAGEIHQILMEPYGPVARSGNLVTLKVEELIGRHIVRQLVSVAIGHEHGREHDTVKHNIVLAYKIDYTTFGTFPPLLPCVGQYFFGIGDISYRRVKPHI